jgi:DNA-binding response OmpR family regulator
MSDMKKILVVDDEKINLDFFSLMLSKLGFEVEVAYNGEEALKKVRSSIPDLILLDIVMPKMSGWEVTHILKADERYANIPIIMLSGMAEVKDKVEGFELGVDDYITNPFNFTEVLARGRSVLRSRELFNQLVLREVRLGKAEKMIVDLASSVREILKESGSDKLADLEKRMEEFDRDWDALKTKEMGLDKIEERMRLEINR